MLREKRRCSKCGIVRPAELERCPNCGTRRSCKLKPHVVSFWHLTEDVRKEIASLLLEAIVQHRSADDAALGIFEEQELPQFKEYYRFFRMLRWSYQVDGVDQLDSNWYRQKPSRRVNPFTGLHWPPRGL